MNVKPLDYKLSCRRRGNVYPRWEICFICKWYVWSPGTCVNWFNRLTISRDITEYALRTRNLFTEQGETQELFIKLSAFIYNSRWCCFSDSVCQIRDCQLRFKRDIKRILIGLYNVYRWVEVSKSLFMLLYVVRLHRYVAYVKHCHSYMVEDSTFVGGFVY